MNNEFIKDLTKGVINSDVGKQELTPGVTGRRYDPHGGVAQHNARIQRESKCMDTYGNLPFTFSKPKKDSRSKFVKCTNCGTIKYVNKTTVGIICSSCKVYAAVQEVDNE
jgi:hypothetical protein